jgi:hypothetical protein
MSAGRISHVLAQETRALVLSNLSDVHAESRAKMAETARQFHSQPSLSQDGTFERILSRVGQAYRQSPRTRGLGYVEYLIEMLATFALNPSSEDVFDAIAKLDSRQLDKWIHELYEPRASGRLDSQHSSFATFDGTPSSHAIVEWIGDTLDGWEVLRDGGPSRGQIPRPVLRDVGGE